MITQTPSLTWEEAHKSFYLHMRAVRSANTAIWYRKYIKGLTDCAEAQAIPLNSSLFCASTSTSPSPQTPKTTPAAIHHDKLAACAFFKLCFKNDVIPPDPLKERTVRNVTKPHKYMPTAEEAKSFFRQFKASITQKKLFKKCNAFLVHFHHETDNS